MNRPKELLDTIDMMQSSDYKERFKAEYYQLTIRCEKLENMIHNWDKLNFTPTCEKYVYLMQLAAMQTYIKLLRYRAELEEIEL